MQTEAEGKMHDSKKKKDKGKKQKNKHLIYVRLTYSHHQ